MWRGLMLNRAVQHFLEDVALGPPRLPARRHAARHGRHPDGPGPHAAPHRGARRDHPAARRPEGGGAGRRHGAQGAPAGGRGHREHVGVHLRPRRELRPVRRGRRRAPGGGDRRAADRRRSRCIPTWSAGGDAGEPVALGEGPLADAFAALAGADHRRHGPRGRDGRCTARMLEHIEQAVAAGGARRPGPTGPAPGSARRGPPGVDVVAVVGRSSTVVGELAQVRPQRKAGDGVQRLVYVGVDDGQEVVDGGPAGRRPARRRPGLALEAVVRYSSILPAGSPCGPVARARWRRAAAPGRAAGRGCRGRPPCRRRAGRSRPSSPP